MNFECLRFWAKQKGIFSIAERNGLLVDLRSGDVIDYPDDAFCAAYEKKVLLDKKILDIDKDRNNALFAVTYKDFIFSESSLKTFYTEISIAERKKQKVQWITKDNQFIELTVLQAYKIADDVSDQIKQIYFDARRKKDEIINGSD